ncbi:uncharacterized protein F4812DRAFT_434391 [Daldinia caldariorum]|uniref:uncharacterized protein n=1 Tax=Daldinia caldariorum TaxID=326644 RepID=UPI0020078F5E|nr:uncharacterized protein F4812DRAFT_434391 [Daldinia caldariorum]KAI1466520.1 hypothetical protein F4812DRAFT_434391 [Daldinia caldariorum]
MATKKDMRRPDLVVPYQEPVPKPGDNAEISSTLSSTLPMAAIFTRNRYVGWASVVISIQNWLGESEEVTRSNNSTPGYFTVGMSVMALAVTYLPMFLPPPPNQATGTGPAAPVAPAAA